MKSGLVLPMLAASLFACGPDEQPDGTWAVGTYATVTELPGETASVAIQQITLQADASVDLWVASCAGETSSSARWTVRGHDEVAVIPAAGDEYVEFGGLHSKIRIRESSDGIILTSVGVSGAVLGDDEFSESNRLCLYCQNVGVDQAQPCP